MVSGKLIVITPIYFATLIDLRGVRVNFQMMEIDDLLPQRRDDPLVAVVRQDLDPLSVEELHERITTLESEITRVQQKIKQVVNQRVSADALFKK